MKRVIVFRTSAYGTWREKYGGIAAFAHAAGWSLHPVDARAVTPDFKELLDFWKPEGIVVDASGRPERFAGVTFGGVPAVYMNPDEEILGVGKPSVASDSAEIAKLALAELLEGNPLSLIFVGWYRRRHWSEEKKIVAQRIARMHGVPLEVVTPAEGDEEKTIFLENKIAAVLKRVERPCGLFAITDDIGALALSAAARLGLEVPRDVMVAAVDDDPEVCENCTPSLTSVRPDFHRLGFLAAARLQKEIEGGAGDGQAAITVVPPVGIVRRASTAQLSKADPLAGEALEMIRREACNGLRPARVAKVFGLSRRMAEIRFKRATGKTIGQAILDRRFAAACDYLREGTATIAAIADFCGWNSDVAFRKAYKSKFGAAPTKKV